MQLDTLADSRAVFTRGILAPMPSKTQTLEQLRSFSVQRSLWKPTTLQKAIERLQFVQADPIRAPARAQDLILRHRVKGYRAGDLERRYPKLNVEEDILPNYGFVPREVLRLMHPRRIEGLKIERDAPGLSERVLEFVRANGATHPRDLEPHFGRERVGNYWGGGSSATTRALDGLHYRGLLRIAWRDNGIKVYEAHVHVEKLQLEPLEPHDQAAALVALIVNLYAPLPEASLGQLISHLGYGAPHLKAELRLALRDAKSRLESVAIDGVRYLWPVGETLGEEVQDSVRLLAPFDPVVWDRRRFEQFHGWAYRFEAYTPAPKRTRGYYALPMLWRDRVIGWANLKVVGGNLEADVGFVDKRLRERAFKLALDAELESMREFLGLDGGQPEHTRLEKTGPV